MSLLLLGILAIESTVQLDKRFLLYLPAVVCGIMTRELRIFDKKKLTWQKSLLLLVSAMIVLAVVAWLTEEGSPSPYWCKAMVTSLVPLLLVNLLVPLE